MSQQLATETRCCRYLLPLLFVRPVSGEARTAIVRESRSTLIWHSRAVIWVHCAKASATKAAHITHTANFKAARLGVFRLIGRQSNSFVYQPPAQALEPLG